MIHHQLTIHLLSEAEPGTGKGTEALDGLLPRNVQGLPILPAAQLKGLLRDKLEELRELHNWPGSLIEALLGQPGDNGEDGRLGCLRLTDAVPAGGKVPKILHISRTAVGEYGTAHDGSLRTVEAIATGTDFNAELWIDDKPDGILDRLTRLGLMSIEAVGGGRTRGAGLCRIEVDCESRTPGMLLKDIDAQAQGCAEKYQIRPIESAAPANLDHDAKPVWLRLIFRAESPVCCPENPINGSTNHIRSGPVIPASAVQGALLTRLSSINNSLATACFHDPRFRAWPLLPVLSLDDMAEENTIPFGVRVDLTHRMGKTPNDDGSYEVGDTAIEPYHWSDVAGGSPLKSSDGILRRVVGNEDVTLWRAGDLPRIISSHSAHWSDEPEGRRNLFSVEALAPMVFSSLVSMPVEAAAALKQALATDPYMAFGKARGIRGVGRLELETIADIVSILSANPAKPILSQVFVVQSPLALPDEYPVRRAEEALADLAQKAGWGKVVLNSEHNGHFVTRSAATCGVRFGWNRHDLGDHKADARHKRLRARRVILPGSVMVMEHPLDDLPGKLLAGLGDGREQGFGALLPHPGLAVGMPYRPEPETNYLQSQDDAGVKALGFFRAAGEAKGPSPSQIAAVSRRLGDCDQVVKYLNQQVRRGSASHWHRWEPVFGKLSELVAGDQDFAARVLRAWQDLAIIHRPDKEN